MSVVRVSHPLQARPDDHAVAAEQMARARRNRDKDGESKELGEHRPVEMDVEMAEDESHTWKRSKVTALTIGGRLVNGLMQLMSWP